MEDPLEKTTGARPNFDKLDEIPREIARVMTDLQTGNSRLKDRVNEVLEGKAAMGITVKALEGLVVQKDERIRDLEGRVGQAGRVRELEGTVKELEGKLATVRRIEEVFKAGEDTLIKREDP